MFIVEWFRALFSSEQSTPATHGQGRWTGHGYLGAVGESQYQPALQAIARRSRECQAILIPEPDNPFDANAVVVKIDGVVVGYLTRADARRYRSRLLALPQPFCCPAKLIGGTRDKPSFGVLLDHRELERMPVPKRPRKKREKIDPNEQPF